MDYKVVKYSEIGKIRSGKRLPKGYTVSEEISENKYIRVRDINNGSIDSSIVQYISDEAAEKLERYRVKTRDVIISVVGTVGAIAQIEESLDGAYLTENCDNLQVDESICLKDYLKYYLLSEDGSKEIIANTVGSTQPKLPIYGIENFNIKLPSIDNQKRIVRLLNSIDNKIKLNNQINNNLHELMEIQFNRWIEDLEEYEESNLTTIANYTNGLAMQKFRPNENEKSLPVVKIKEMNSGISQDTERCSLDVKDEVKVYDGDILFAWSGTLCMTIWCGGNAGLNQHIFKVTSDKYPKWFYYFWTLKYLNKFKMIAEGKTTTMGHIQRKELDNSEVKLPSKVELKRMNSIMEPLLEKYIANNVSNRTLEQLRDTLLPKLMNGEIDLDNIEI